MVPRNSTCECLRDGRNYRWKGRRLDDGHPDQVFECNLNCACHLKSCRNRLGQRGMTCKLEVSCGEASVPPPRLGTCQVVRMTKGKKKEKQKKGSCNPSAIATEERGGRAGRRAVRMLFFAGD